MDELYQKAMRAKKILKEANEGKIDAEDVEIDLSVTPKVKFDAFLEKTKALLEKLRDAED